MTLNEDFLVSVVEKALELSGARGEQVISPTTWQDADTAFDWPDGDGPAAYWGERLIP